MLIQPRSWSSPAGSKSLRRSGLPATDDGCCSAPAWMSWPTGPSTVAPIRATATLSEVRPVAVKRPALLGRVELNIVFPPGHESAIPPNDLVSSLSCGFTLGYVREAGRYAPATVAGEGPWTATGRQTVAGALCVPSARSCSAGGAGHRHRGQAPHPPPRLRRRRL